MHGSTWSVAHSESSISHSPHLPWASAGIRGRQSGCGGKTLSIENVQSLNAAYATSGSVYLGDHDTLASISYPNSTMTLGRTYKSKATGIRSSPNISSSLEHLHLDSVAYGNHGAACHQRSFSPHAAQARIDGYPLTEHLWELDSKFCTAGSSGSSFRNFWSPEFKKKKGTRKDKMAKTSMLKKPVQEENQVKPSGCPQHFQMTIQASYEELSSKKNFAELLQQENSEGSLGSPSDPCTYTELTECQTNELFHLRKTLEEMDLHNKSQRQTVSSRDEAFKKLMEMLEDKGHVRSGLINNESLGVSCEAEEQLGIILEQKRKEILHLRKELHCKNPHTEPSRSKAMPNITDMKDTKISSLERNLHALEDEIQMLKSSSMLNVVDGEERLKQIDVYKNHSKFMKAKIDQLKAELTKKESEMLALQTQLETLTNQNSDCKQHIEVLKESLTAKEQRDNILQTEVDALRVRLEEKESFLNKKSKQLQDVTDEKGMLSGEIRDLKDMLDVKERKITILQKKIENLQDQLKDKEKQLECLRDRVKSLQMDSSNTDTALTTLEEALSEKERVIEHLKEQKERALQDKQGEMEACKKENKELKDKIASLQAQLLERGNPVKGRAAALEAGGVSRTNPEVSDRLTVLEKEVTVHKEEAAKCKAEVDRLLGVLRGLESQCSEKDMKISELERQAKELNKNLPSAKPTQLEETRPSNATMPSNTTLQAHNNQDLARETAEKIKELEKALRESMNTSSHREALWAQEEQAHVLAQRQLEELMASLEKTRQELDVTKQRLFSTQNSLAERDSHLSNMQQERRKQLEEILEMKQQALLAAISEKDANIALLELSAPPKKSNHEEVMALKREKDKLMYQLKQQTQSRMKLLAENYEDGQRYPHHPPHSQHGHPGHGHYRAPPRGPPSHSNHQPQLEQDDEEGIWA
ncbi:ERC protein 2 [Trichomycterus rosablanca]|uniref:ERC protein 2 n=1 Tax=Trichomycterus rosablanca TaxID=2290929 RepID=UPI002F35247E